MRLKRSLTLAAAGLIGLAAIVVPSTPALAAPCYAYRLGTFRFAAESACNPGTYGWQHRVVIQCKEHTGSSYVWRTYYGPWKGGTTKSQAICPQSATSDITYWVQQEPQDFD
jgi:hypothetical protein